jgi:hypothetical protein
LNHVIEVELLHQIDPASVDVKLLDARLKIRSALVLLDQEELLCLFDAASGEEELYLVLWGDLEQLVHLAEDHVLS